MCVLLAQLNYLNTLYYAEEFVYKNTEFAHKYCRNHIRDGAVLLKSGHIHNL